MSPFIHVAFPAFVASFPSRVGTASGGTSSLTDDPVLDLTALPRTEGNVMVLAFRSAASGHTGITGWTERADVTYTARSDTVTVWSRVVGAGEAATQTFVTSGSNRCGWVAFEYSGAHGDVAASIVEGLDPPNLTPAWGSAKTAWGTVGSVAASDNTLTAPTGYTGQVDGASAASTADTRTRLAMAQRENEAASENPSTWSVSGTSFFPMSATFAVRPV